MKRTTRFVVYGGLAIGCLIAVGAAVVWNASTELIAPKRRVLQEYHREWLDRPAEHGVSIQRFTAMGGEVPCLVVMPNAGAGLSKRGKTVRQQLEEKGVALRPFGEAFANLVLLHGRNGRKEDLLPVAERFCAVGFRCVIPDLPAHGESPLKTVRFGNSDFEASLPGTVLEEAKERFHFPDEPAGLWGMSMGGAFLARAASLSAAPWKALVVVCSFDSLDSVVGQKVASYTSVTAPLWNSLIAQVCVARGGVDPALVRPAQWAGTVEIPVFVAHGDADSLITLDQGRRLFEAYASKDKAWTVVKGGDHNRVLVTEHPLYAEMAEWYLRYLRAAEK